MKEHRAGGCRHDPPCASASRRSMITLTAVVSAAGRGRNAVYCEAGARGGWPSGWAGWRRSLWCLPTEVGFGVFVNVTR
jgi:hypothetical protein